LIKIRISI
jgi:hypothetical protein